MHRILALVVLLIVSTVASQGSPVAFAEDADDTVALVDVSRGQWHLRDSLGRVTSFYYGNPGDVPFVGDWDCSGTDTPGLFRTSDAFAYLRNSNTQGVADVRFFFGNPSDIPLAGDFNGDGCDTLSIYRPSEQRFYIMNKLGENNGGLGAAEYSFAFGNPGDKPVVGDWDGDGVDEVGLHRESSGFFYYRNASTTGIADGQFYFGDPGDRFVAGDWGVVDGKETPALFRPSNLTFYFRHTLTQGNADSQFTWSGAEPGWIPVSGAFGLDAGVSDYDPPPGSVAVCGGLAHAESFAPNRVSTDRADTLFPSSAAGAERVRVSIGEFEYLREVPVYGEEGRWLADVALLDEDTQPVVETLEIVGFGERDSGLYPYTDVSAYDLTGDGRDDFTVCLSAWRGNWLQTSALVFTDHMGLWDVRVRQVYRPGESTALYDGWISSLGGGVIEIADAYELYAGQCVQHDVKRYRWTGNQFVWVEDSTRWSGVLGVQCP